MRISTSLQHMTFKERPSELVLLRARNRRLNTLELTVFKNIKGCFRKKKDDPFSVHSD